MTAETALFLFGIYLFGGGLALAASPARVRAMIEGFETQPALCYVTGALLALGGASLLLAFRDIGSLPRGIVAFLGAGMLAEGLMFMAAPGMLLSLARPFLPKDGALRSLGVVVIALAAGLLYAGFPR